MSSFTHTQEWHNMKWIPYVCQHQIKTKIMLKWQMEIYHISCNFPKHSSPWVTISLQNRSYVVPRYLAPMSATSTKYSPNPDLGDMNIRYFRQRIGAYNADCLSVRKSLPPRTYAAIILVGLARASGVSDGKKFNKLPLKLGCHLKQSFKILDRFRALAMQDAQQGDVGLWL